MSGLTSNLLRRPLCWLALCQTFRAESDDTGCWGECFICGKRVGFVDRATLRRFADAEYEREMALLATSPKGGPDHG